MANSRPARVPRETSPDAPTAHATSRLQWLDALRGATMVALLLLHATNLPRLHSGTEMPAAFDSVNTALGPFRMPTLMVLSGMLLHRFCDAYPPRWSS
ncbi:hypothetical protein [Brachybacterium alimentarium]|uniref:hypothetical protein n=1 Tax=Brachybacterium alimentarium TaxID=47845 RepID=UPI003FD4D474